MKNKLSQFVTKLTAIATVAASLAVVSPAYAASYTVMKDTMDRQKAGAVTTTHSFSFTNPTAIAAAGVITITFPGTFTVASAPTGGTGLGTGPTFGFTATTMTATCGTGGCPTGAITITGGTTSTNAAAGSYKLIITNSINADTGSFAIATVSDDQVSVSASVDPSITFVVGAQAATSVNCTGASAITPGGTVALGTLSVGTITSSDVASVNHICSRASTNAGSGVVVSVKSLNGNLKSTSVPADVIPSATAAMAAGTSNYGLCASATVKGLDSTTPTGTTPAAVAPFIASCVADTAAGSVGALTTSAQTVWATTGVVQNGFYLLVIKAAISATQQAHNDYADTLTFVATGTF